MLNRNEQFYDNLALYATALQMIDFLMLVSDVSNNDIMEALQQQNKEYMEKIIDQITVYCVSCPKRTCRLNSSITHMEG